MPMTTATKSDIARAMARRIRHELRNFEAEQQLSIMGDLFIELTEVFDEFKLNLSDLHQIDLNEELGREYLERISRS